VLADYQLILVEPPAEKVTYSIIYHCTCKLVHIFFSVHCTVRSGYAVTCASRVCLPKCRICELVSFERLTSRDFALDIGIWIGLDWIGWHGMVWNEMKGEGRGHKYPTIHLAGTVAAGAAPHFHWFICKTRGAAKNSFSIKFVWVVCAGFQFEGCRIIY